MTPSRPTSRSGIRSRCSSCARTPSGFIEEVRGDEPEIAAKMRIEEREVEGVGGVTDGSSQYCAARIR
jgi:hypothetical protein